MTAIPQAYLDTILPLIGMARDFLEHDETLAAIAFVVSFSFETRHGIWMAQAPIKPKGYSKKKRTFAEVSFIHYEGAEGRFTGLLPGAGAGSAALH